MKYFNNCKTPEEAKKLWRKLAMKMHPDKGGNKDEFIEMNAEYYAFCENQSKNSQAKKQFDIHGFEKFIRQNFGMDLEDSIELVYKLFSDIANLLNRKYPLLGFLINAVADKGYSKGKQIIEDKKQNDNSRSSSQTEVEDDDIKVE